MQEIILDEEFKALLPALDKESFAQFEENIIENGCMIPLVLWDNILIDGFNRYKICMEHDIPFKTISKEFDSRERVLIWIILNQVSRRNLTPLQLSYYRGLHYKMDKMLVKNSDGKNQHSEVSDQNDHKARNQSTAQRLSMQYKVSPITIRRDSQVAEAIDILGEASPEAKRNVLSGAAGITRKQLKELLTGTEEEISDIAAMIEEGPLERRRPKVSEADEDRDPAEHFVTDPSPLETAVKRLTDTFLSELRANSGSATAAEQRAALKSHIADLEELLVQI